MDLSHGGSLMKALLLAGGSGARLWPLSRSNFPKQFLKLSGKESFLQKTIARNLNVVSWENLYIITNEGYLDEVLRQIREIDPRLEGNILLEPTKKNTAPAIAYAFEALNAKKEDFFLITPADHLIAPVDKYVHYVREGRHLAEGGDLVTFGVRPTRPETGYGYIKCSEGMAVEAFVEKPDLETAQKYLLSGDYFWNSGMFLFSVGAFRREIERHAPEIAGKSFDAMSEISIDHALMERSKHVVMIPLDLSWSDIGSWENVYEMLDKDGANNAIRGNVLAFDTTNSLILAEKRLVSTIGLDDIVIIETDDVVLVAEKKETQRVKEVVALLKNLGTREIDEHSTVYRPWGSYTVLMEGERYKIKKIFVAPKGKLSLQMHYHRSEHWVVVSGTANVMIGEREAIVHEGQSIFVPKSAVHRVENPGKVPLEIIEVQVGEYLGEDDIIRLEDSYGRIKEAEVFQLLRNG